ncbi:uncharacterized protein K02A2.6-like [Fundulus heteroclitus]|uniref:uncharacterized protein K02A2.6-like n=1 Tax=Fundulus heteroclitus TaxID=8078 RepID=UPI00165C844C|nr:uncharacterized protein K02A2.6-like [Fundulus heteroclitus]
MSTVGTLSEYVEADGDWVEYVERLQHFFVANDINDQSKQRSVLLSVCGAKTYKLIRNLASPRKPGELSFQDIVKLVQDHHNPKPSVIVQRFKFHTHSRKQGVSVPAFVAELRALSEHCEFGDVLNDMLRDRLVCGINDDSIQRRLLSEAKLTYKKALEIAQAMETATNNTKDIQQARGGAPQSDTVHHVTKEKKGKQQKSVECYRCGGPHLASDCGFKDSVCHNCQKRGHVAKVCRGKNKKKTDWGGKQNMSTHHLQEEEEPQEEEESSYNMFNLHAISQPRAEPIYATVKVNGADLKMEVDTGASVSVLSKNTYHQLWQATKAPVLKKSDIKLRTYTGECISIIGAIEVDIDYEGQKAAVKLLVVKGEGPSLLDRDILQKIRLQWGHIWGEVKHMTAVQDIIAKYSDVFKDELGTLRGTTVKLSVDPKAQPRFYKPRPVPYAMRVKVEAELERLQQAGVIEPVEFSNWAAPIVLVMKEDGGVRICGDYKLTINQASQLDTYPLPKVEDLFAMLAGGQTFTKLDMSHAYQQLLLDEESKQYVTINTHKGLFKYNRLAFGVASSPGIFQRTMDNLFQNLPHVAVYLDDILVTGSTEEEHVRNLDQVLRRLSEAGLRLKRSKCVFQAQSVTYLGHRISAQGLSPVEEKVRAIKEAPSPKNVAELRSFLGLVNYYGKFLPDLSTVLAPLYKLLHKDSWWKWQQAQEEEFQQVKRLLHSDRLLVHFDPAKEVVLSCDASPYGVGAVLSHRLEDRTEKPISYVSRTLTTAEQGYSQLEKEGLAVVFAVRRSHQYLYGRQFAIFTDHKPLMGLFSELKAIPPMASARIQRWALTLSAYQYHIVYRAGRENGNADAFSRLPLPDTPGHTVFPPETVFLMDRLANTPVTAKQIKTWTERDPVLSQVKRWVMQGWPVAVGEERFKPYAKRKLELSVLDGCILWGSRVIVPLPGQAQVMDALHDAHPGVSRMKNLARSFVWWPGMDSALEERVKKCSQCQSNQKLPAVAPLHPWQWPGRAWSRLHLDFAGPFMGQTFLVLVDAHSKWLDAHIMSKMTAAITADKLRSIFAIHGLPDTVVTDNGPTFTSEVFKEFMEKNGIRHVCSAPYHPASNGLAERAVETLKDGLRKMTGNSLETKLSRLLFQYRITPHTTTGVSPAEMLLGRRPKSHLDLLHPDIAERVIRGQDTQRIRWDQHAKDRLFRPGDHVYVKNFATGLPWLPGVIQHQTGPVSFVVDLLDGRQVRRHQDHLRDRYDEGGEGRQLGEPRNRAFSPAGSAEVPQAPEEDQGTSEEPAAPDTPLAKSAGPGTAVAQSAGPGTQVAPRPTQLEGAPEPRRSTRPHRPPERLNW